MPTLPITRRGFLSAAGSALVLGAQTEGVDFKIKDDVRLAGFAWPVSHVSYPLEFTNPHARPEEFRLMDVAANRAVAFQLTGISLEQGRVAKAVIHFLTDLPSGGERQFRLTFDGNGEAQPAGVTVARGVDSVTLANGLVRVEIPARGVAPPVMRLGDARRWLGAGKWEEVPAECRVEEISVGTVFAEYRLTYAFSRGRSYRVHVRLTAQMEFVELDEQMEGFAAGAPAEWRLVWDGIKFTHRYTRTRPGQAIDNRARGYRNFAWEPVAGVAIAQDTENHPLRADDQKLGPGGMLPMKIAPYHNWMSWWRLPSAAFWNEAENVTAGVFITDMEKWDDGLYALWGSKDALCVHFHLREGRLDWSFPLANGTRAIALAVYPHTKDLATVERANKPMFYVDDLRRWHGWLPLDKVRQWVLDFEPRNSEFPRFFETGDKLLAQSAANFERTIATSNMIGAIPNESERGSGPTPVGSRTFHTDWTPRLDVSAAALSPEGLRRVQAAYAFLAYLHADETLMPMKKLLSGHPNFLADVKGVIALTVFLLPQHPEAANWADHYEKFLELNLRYHVRPGVAAWDSRGGRWTENLGTYVWAAVVPMVRGSFLLHHRFDGRNRILQPNLSLLAMWLLNGLTAPLDTAGGKRVNPPQGAHSRRVPPSYILRVLGQEMMQYDPLTAEHLLWATYGEQLGFENEDIKGPWSKMLRGWEENRGTNPRLRSAKFTGYGFVLRSEFGAPREISVFLQQIDAGPNYRWGRASHGGNGVIYYYAAGRSYSHNGIEDVGDGYFGDVERSTNFGVKKAGGYRSVGEYRAVGQNDLSEPLYDFGFAQFAQVNANGEAAPEYLSRSVMMGGTDYIVVHDRVRDEQVEGRFAWFTGVAEDFPSIHQLKPGAAPADVKITRVSASYARDPETPATKGRHYDGRGSFLTVVSHRAELVAKATPYGCEVSVDGRTERIFERPDSSADFMFEGTAGFCSDGPAGRRAALFQGTRMATRGVTLEVIEGAAGIGMAEAPGGFEGLAYTLAGATVRFTGRDLPLYVDGVRRSGDVKLGPGMHRWQWTTEAVVPPPTQVLRTVNRAGGFAVEWQPVAGAISYDVELSKDAGEHWSVLAKAVAGSRYAASGLPDGVKVHVRLVPNGATRQGAPSADYPVYISAAAPPAPEGLRIARSPGIVTITWGEVLGAGMYRLYRRRKGQGRFEMVAGGAGRRHVDDDADVFEYRVTAVNDNGESEPGTVTDTDRSRFVNWDPKPGEVFRRDTESAENGYFEYSNWIEETLPVLRYP